MSKSIIAIVDDDARALTTLKANGKGHAYNVTNIFSVAEYAGFAPRPGSKVEISFREVGTEAEENPPRCGKICATRNEYEEGRCTLDAGHAGTCYQAGG